MGHTNRCTGCGLEWDLVQNKHDRLAEFEKACAEALSLREHARVYFDQRREIQEYIYSLPFEEQKRIVEAVISPETGGRVTARYFIPMRDGDYEGSLSEEAKKELWKPDMSESPVVEFEFGADIERIEDLITGIDRRGLLDKVSSVLLSVDVKRNHVRSPFLNSASEPTGDLRERQVTAAAFPPV